MNTLKDGSEEFEVTLIQVESASRVVLFAVGGGGNPQRHLPLLTALAERGCTVIAPHFDRLVTPVTSDQELLLRARRLKLALDTVARPGIPVAGVGHSIGATMLLALAGAQMWMGPGQRVPVEPDKRLDRLVLLTPATGFFQAPGALDTVQTPILAWAGTADGITPPAQALVLAQAMSPRVPVEVRVEQGAGHFTFMNTPPPNMAEPHPNREGFLATLAADVCHFVTG